MYKLTELNVETILTKCLFDEGEDTTNFLVGESLGRRIAFHKGRILQNKAFIQELCGELPASFKCLEGNSLVSMYMRFDGSFWTEQRSYMDMLLALGTASNSLQLLYPRKEWGNLPDKLPIIKVV